MNRVTRASSTIEQLLRSRSERVIAGGRLAIAVFVLGAIWADPSQPSQLQRETYTILVLYTIAAGTLFLVQRQNALLPTRLGLLVHSFELPVHLAEMGVFAFLLYTTDGVTSPFFPLFTFSIVSATFRWGWRGALWTSVAVLVLLIVSAAIHVEIRPIPLFEIDRFLIRCAHVTVIGAMLGYFGFHQQKIQGEMLRLGSWHPGPFELARQREYMESCAAYAADVFGGSRVALAVQGRDEPIAICVHYERDSVRQDRLLSHKLDLGAPELGEACLMGRRADREILALSQGGTLGSVPGSDRFRRLYALFGADHLLSAPIRSDLFSGVLLVLDRPDFSVEEMMVANIIARQVEGGLDRMEALDAIRRAAAGEERVRMARDLHDGVLQTLAATAMHLEGLSRSSSKDPQRIAVLQDWLLREQRELRALIGRLRAHNPTESLESDIEGAPGLATFVNGLERQWGITIRLVCRPPELRLNPQVAFQVRQIVREAAANAVRHGGATELTVDLARERARLDVRIADNGTGLGLSGGFDAEQCRKLGLGPRNLHERVSDLNGSFRLHSGPHGLRLEISLPLDQENER